MKLFCEVKKTGIYHILAVCVCGIWYMQSSWLSVTNTLYTPSSLMTNHWLLPKYSSNDNSRALINYHSPGSPYMMYYVCKTCLFHNYTTHVKTNGWFSVIIITRVLWGNGRERGRANLKWCSGTVAHHPLSLKVLGGHWEMRWSLVLAPQSGCTCTCTCTWLSPRVLKIVSSFHP